MQWPNIHHAAMRKFCVGTASRHPRTLPLGQLGVVDLVGHGSQTNHVEPGMGQRPRHLSAHVLIATGVTPTHAAASPRIHPVKTAATSDLTVAFHGDEREKVFDAERGEGEQLDLGGAVDPDYAVFGLHADGKIMQPIDGLDGMDLVQLHSQAA